MSRKRVAITPHTESVVQKMRDMFPGIPDDALLETLAEIARATLQVCAWRIMSGDEITAVDVDESVSQAEYVIEFGLYREAQFMKRVRPVIARRLAMKTRDECKADLDNLLAQGLIIPSQNHLAKRWGVTRGAVSKWMTRWCDEDPALRSVMA